MSVREGQAESRQTRRDDGPRLAFRPDIEGLRAVAILLVVGYHAGLPFLPGGFIGVDVFFVISGFLITGLLVAEVRASGRVSLAAFWARRARRLLPAAVLVLVVVAAASWLVIPAIDHDLVGGDIIASSLYVSNLRFALQSTDYLDSTRAESPVLNYWSLGVEEQFYLVWPLLVLGVAVLLVARLRARPLPALAVVLAVLGALSFVLSLRLTASSQPWAFFGTPARAWEFAMGGLLAIAAAGGLALARRLRLVLGIAGLAMVLGAALRLDSDVPYPGSAAVWPVVGTALLIAAGTGRHGDAAVPTDRLLASAPMGAIGRLSYSWYLWHWPVLVLVAAWLGPQGVVASTALVVLSLVPAALAHRFVERPIHHARSLVGAPAARSLRLGGALTLLGVLAGGLLLVVPGGGALAAAPAVGAASVSAEAADNQRTQPSPEAAEPTRTASGAALAAPATGSKIRPQPDEARGDLPTTYADGCHRSYDDTSVDGCVFGEAGSSTTVVLLGDSHAAQWFPTLEKVADQRGWRLLSRTKVGCAAPDVTLYLRSQKRAYSECDAWRAAVLDEVTAMSPRPLVVATSTQTESLVNRDTSERMEGEPAQQEWRDGWGRTLTRLSEAGVPVVVLRDTPWPGVDMARCVSQSADEPSVCDVPRSTLSSPSFDIDLVEGIDGAEALDLTDALCSATVCPAVIGPYLVYRDDNHLTATFAESLAGRLGKALAPRVG